MTPEEAQVVQDGRLAAGWDWCPDDMHDTLEEKMSATIAAFKYEYGTLVPEHDDEPVWWGTESEARQAADDHPAIRIVCRLVGPAEVIEP